MCRASQQEMISNAERETNATGSSLPSGMRSTLVDNAQPMSYTGPSKTAFDSCVWQLVYREPGLFLIYFFW